jgi:hypothetical protein
MKSCSVDELSDLYYIHACIAGCTECASFQYETRACTTQQDRVCTNCTVPANAATITCDSGGKTNVTQCNLGYEPSADRMSCTGKCRMPRPT